MPVRERAVPPPAPVILPQVEPLPWVRLITGLVAAAILAMPAARHHAEWSSQPIADRAISVAELPPLESEALPARELPRPSLKALAPAAHAARSDARPRSSFVRAQHRSELRAQAPSRRVPQLAATRHGAGAAMRVAARGRHGLTRAQVVREYLAAREQVAALTREDSGSAYLTRVAALRRAGARRHGA